MVRAKCRYCGEFQSDLFEHLKKHPSHRKYKSIKQFQVKDFF